MHNAVERMNAGAVTTVTYSTSIWPGEPMVMGSTDTTLEFAPGTSGTVTVTLNPTTPQNPPPGGAIPRTWEITTTAASYKVTATFTYGPRPPDIVLVLDTSGSMEFNTLCYGCWDSSDDDYPDGDLYPLVWDGPANGAPERCGPTQRYQYSGEDYYFIEAEEYSYASNAYDRDLYTVGYTYWVLQRRPSSASSRGRDIVGRGAYILHMPYPDMEVYQGGGVTCRYEDLVADVDPADGAPDFNCWSGAPGGPYPAPRVDYNFTPLQSDNYYIWVRGQSAGTWRRDDNLDRRLFWGINGQLGWGSHTGCGGLLGCETYFTRGTGYDGASNYWQWRRLNDSAIGLVAGTEYTLNFWAGGAEFAFDRIAITSYPGGSDGDPPVPIDWNSERGVEEWANGRGGWACDPCDPRFAGYPADHPDRPSGFDPSDWVGTSPICDTDQRTDDIYDDEQYMRAVIEATKTFVTELLDPRHDQVGYVRYSTDSEIVSELQCLRREGMGYIPECNEDVMDSTVVAELDDTWAGGSTNIAGGMLDGLQVLSTQSRHYGRPGADRVMIVTTDGQANVTPNSACYNDPDRQWLDGAGTNAQDCVIYYAYEACAQGVIVDTVTLGTAADLELMQAVADLTGGVHRNAETPGELDAIFTKLYELHHPPPPSFRAGAIYHRDTPTGTWTLHPLTMTWANTATWAVTGTGITALSEWTLGYPPPHQVMLEAALPVLPADGASTAVLTATVADFHGQPVQDGTIVTFATSLGSVSPAAGGIPGSVSLPLSTSGGIVTALLTAGLEPGWAVVTATVGEVGGTTLVEIEALPPHRVALVAAPTALPADGASTAILSTTVTDVYSQPVQVGTTVTFAASRDCISPACGDIPGSVVPSLGTNASGVVTVCLTAGLEPGWAAITATAGVATGTTSVEFEPLHVELEAVPGTLPADGVSTAILAATVRSVSGVPVEEGIIVAFATSLGSVFPSTGATVGGVVTAILTASVEPGWAVITATAGGVTGTAYVEFESLPPYRVELEAVPDTLCADGVSTAVLTATVTNVRGERVQDGTFVTFATSLGSVWPVPGGIPGSASLLLPTSGGIVTALLTAGDGPGLAVVTATTGGRIGTVEVQFVSCLYLPVVMHDDVPA